MFTKTTLPAQNFWVTHAMGIAITVVMNTGKFVRWAPILLLAAGWIVYANSLGGAFILDDIPWIVNNSRIHNWWPPWDGLSGSSRPLVQWSFAANYALGTVQDVRGYHAANVLIHVLASLALWGIARRAMPLMLPASVARDRVEWCALAASLFWLVHPLQTESVTYVVQRAESMMGLFAMVSIYCVWRGHESPKGWGWYGVAVVASLGAAMSKATMVTLPLVVLLVDVVFLSGSLSEAWRRRKWVYAGFSLSWVLLVFLLAQSRHEWGDTAGYAVGGVTPLAYLQTQPEVVMRYLRLTLWPSGLCLLYEWPFQRPWAPMLFSLMGVAILLALTGWLLRRRPKYGVWLGWFFLFLLPTSSVVPLLHPIFEHRMYLPLAGLMILGVALFQLALEYGMSHRRWVSRLSWVTGVVVLLGLGCGTVARNTDYRTEVSIWQDTVAKSGDNPRAHYALALAYETDGQLHQAAAEFERAVALKPGWPDPHHAWGQMLHRHGDLDGAREQYRMAIEADGMHAASYYDLGVLEYQRGNLGEAERYFERAVAAKPGWDQARASLHQVREVRRQPLSTGESR